MNAKIQSSSTFLRRFPLWTRRVTAGRRSPSAITAVFLSSISNSGNGDTLPPISANVVQGPSLLQTSIARSAPSLMFLPGLRSLPFWTKLDPSTNTNRIAYQDPTLTKVVSYLEANVDTIKQEYQRVAPTLPSDYQPDREHSLHQGSWDWHSYMTKGHIQGAFGQYFPDTTQILQSLREESPGVPSWLFLEDIPFGYAFFSTLHPQSRIQPHVSPMNLRWRIHLPLVVPKVDSSSIADKPACGIRVGHQVQTWNEGKALVLDDSYEHEVWNDTDQTRVLFLLDLWHGDISIHERQDIVGMFRHAHEQGWYNSKSK